MIDEDNTPNDPASEPGAQPERKPICEVRVFSNGESVIEMHVRVVPFMEGGLFWAQGQIGIQNEHGQVVGTSPFRFQIPGDAVEEAFANLKTAFETAAKIEYEKVQARFREQQVEAAKKIVPPPGVRRGHA